ncbi:MAG: alpha-ketoglutarate-dependent dioxygenase AlkB family protein [Flavobacteriaceae bacterium]
MDLFSHRPWNPDLPDANIRYFPNFLSPKKADALFYHFKTNIPWKHEPVKVFGKTYMQPRLTSFHALDSKTYTYSGLTLTAEEVDAPTQALIDRIAELCPTAFDAVLFNLYRDGQDSNGWHADNEKELGPRPQIASISLGAERFFHLKHRTLKEQRLKIPLQHGSLLLMEGDTQLKWLHQIAKTKRKVGPRINLTFRKMF